MGHAHSRNGEVLLQCMITSRVITAALIQVAMIELHVMAHLKVHFFAPERVQTVLFLLSRRMCLFGHMLMVRLMAPMIYLLYTRCCV